MSNYPPGFSGIEGEEEKTFIFYVIGEVEIEHYSEEGAEEYLLDMTLRELIEKGLHIE